MGIRTSNPEAVHRDDVVTVSRPRQSFSGDRELAFFKRDYGLLADSLKSRPKVSHPM